MPIIFHPKAGAVLMCDFNGFRKPEMIKTRPVVIVSPNHLNRHGLYSVVPLSTTAPNRIEPYHYKLEKRSFAEQLYRRMGKM
ncbi:MAG: type II toxin-antitoxin system PemK/MazF family toxin [Pyrinomonadaceae bacterium]